MRFPSEWVDELYARADIVQAVSQYLPLKKKGHNYWGLCPFHHEKTPSFSVNPELNVYYCFGCKAGGNIVQFIMEMERLTYPEALEFLAAQVHLPLPQNMAAAGDEEKQSLKDRLYAANGEAARYFHDLLWKPSGARVLSYLRKRGIDDGAIRKFGLGASAAEWNDLYEHLAQKGFTQEEMRLAGLIAVKENHHFDMFRDRLMFPIINLYGKVLGFGGRTLGDAQPKYLNTADTPVFNKRFGVYAANLLRKERSLKHVLLVEGYMDVISLTKAGVPGVVATLGTALTSEQARLLKRFAPEIWVAYDGDEAGQMAIERAIEIFRQEDIPLKVLKFPDGQDPDDFIKQHGLEAFYALLPMTDTAFRLKRIQEKSDLSVQEGRVAYAKQCAAALSHIKDPVEMEIYLKEVALNSGFSRDVLLAQVQVAGGRAAVAQQKEAERVSKRLPRIKEAADEGAAAEQKLLSLLASGMLPDHFLVAEDFITDRYRELAVRILSGESPAKAMSSIEDDALRSLLGKLLTEDVLTDRDMALSAAEECLSTLKRVSLERSIDALKKRMETETAGEKQTTLQEIMRLTIEKTKLKRTRA